MNYYLECFKKYFDFKGRASQEEFWIFFVLNLLILLLWMISEGLLGINLMSLYLLIIIIPTTSVAVRRLHDVGKSGFYLFWIIFPVVGWFLVLFTLALRGRGDNVYGVSSNEKEEYEFTPLMAASINGDLKAVRKIINSKNCDINKKDLMGKTAIMYAMDNNEFEIVEELIKKGAK